MQPKQTIADLLLLELMQEVKALTQHDFDEAPKALQRWFTRSINNLEKGSVITGAILVTLEQDNEGYTVSSDLFGMAPSVATLFASAAEAIAEAKHEMLKNTLQVAQIEQVTGMPIDDVLKAVAQENPELVTKLFTVHTGETH